MAIWFDYEDYDCCPHGLCNNRRENYNYKPTEEREPTEAEAAAFDEGFGALKTIQEVPMPFDLPAPLLNTIIKNIESLRNSNFEITAIYISYKYVKRPFENNDFHLMGIPVFFSRFIEHDAVLYPKNSRSIEIDFSPINTLTFAKECYPELKSPLIQPKRIIKSGPCTIVIWLDNTKTIVRCSGDDKPDTYAAFCAALAKKIYGTNSNVKRIIRNAKKN